MDKSATAVEATQLLCCSQEIKTSQLLLFFARYTQNGKERHNQRQKGGKKKKTVTGRNVLTSILQRLFQECNVGVKLLTRWRKAVPFLTPYNDALIVHIEKQVLFYLSKKRFL